MAGRRRPVAQPAGGIAGARQADAEAAAVEGDLDQRPGLGPGRRPRRHLERDQLDGARATRPEQRRRVEVGVADAGAEVDPGVLRSRGLVAKRGLVKVLGRGELTKALTQPSTYDALTPAVGWGPGLRHARSLPRPINIAAPSGGLGGGVDLLLDEVEEVADQLPHGRAVAVGDVVDGLALLERGGPITLEPLPLIHGDIISLGYRIGNIGYCPDVSDIPHETAARLNGLDVLIIDALQYKPHPSHLSLSETLDWIERLAPRRAILTHMHIPLDYETVARETPQHVDPAYDGMALEFELVSN